MQYISQQQVILPHYYVLTHYYFYTQNLLLRHTCMTESKKKFYHKTHPRKISHHIATTHIKFTGYEESSGANKLESVTLDDNTGQVQVQDLHCQV